jgi:hypothetical protein
VRRLLAVLFVYLFAFVGAGYSQHHSSTPHSSSHHSSKSKDSSSKTVHVKGYYRKDGTYVAPYDRRAPGTASSSTSTNTPSTRQPYRKDYVDQGYAPHSSVQRDSHGRIKRSKAARADFQRRSPCPSTGKTSGSCPGYVVDHVNPLECGGADAPSNMQWQTVAEGKAKDKTERYCRQ